jgi:hypothetical protein
MKNKMLLLSLLLFLLGLVILSARGAAVEPVKNSIDTMNLIPIAETEDFLIYSFQDGGRICYITENKYSHVVPPSLFCLP